MRLDQFVADVMEQLRDFVPEGGEVHFECMVYPHLHSDGRLENLLWHNGEAGERLVFIVPMNNSRVSVPAKPGGGEKVP